MQATSAQSIPNQRAATTAVLAAVIFAAGTALGALAVTAVAPKAATIATSQALNGDVAGLRLLRSGEIGLGGTTIVLPNRVQLQEQTAGAATYRYEAPRGK